MLLLIGTKVKEFLAAIVLIGIVVYFWNQPAPIEQNPEARNGMRGGGAAARAERGTIRAPIPNNPTPSTAATAGDGSLTSRWQTGANSPTATTAASDGSLANRWKPRP